jgi:hypothetical protein
MYRFVGLLGVAALALATGASGDDNKPPKEQCSVEILLNGQEHQVVCQDAEQDFLFLVGPRPGAQCVAEQSLVPGEPALDLPPLAVHPLVTAVPRLLAEPPDHLRAVLGLGLLAAVTAAAQRDHRRAHAQVLTRPGVVSLGVVARVGQEGVGHAPSNRGPDGGSELGRVGSGPACDVGGEEQVGAGVENGRQLGPPAASVPAPGLPGVVAARVAGFKPGRIDGRPRGGREPLGGASRLDRGAQEGVGRFFSRMRSAAFWSVEWSGTVFSPIWSRRSDQSLRCCSMPR